MAFLAAAAIGLAVWEIQTWKGEDSAKVASLDRSTATATIENVFFTGEFAFSSLSLGLFAEAEQRSDNSTQTALPISNDVDSEDRAKFFDVDGDFAGQDLTYRLFDYRHVYPAYTFIPLLLLLVGVPLLLMLYAGFATARSMGARIPGWGAVYGLSVGVVWAFGLLIVRALLDAESISGDSLFACALLIGGAVGAMGGALAALGAPGTGTGAGTTAPAGAPPQPPAPPHEGR